MKITLLVTAVSMVALSWLGISFATPTTASEEFQAPVGSGQIVSPEHADSHRLGEVIEEEPALPAWDSTLRPPTGLALVVVD